MSAPPQGFFPQLAPQLAADGYLPIPIKPGTKACFVDDWRNFRIDGKDLSKWEDYGTGLLCGHLVGLDIDVLHPEAAAELATLAEQMLGHGPRRYGLWPKVLLAYRTTVPFQKKDSTHFSIDGYGENNHVEVLVNGQQFVAYHIHPATDRPYEWPNSNPLNTPFKQLTEVTEEQICAYLKKAEEVLAKYGKPPEKNHKDRDGEGVNLNEEVAKAKTTTSGAEWANCMLRATAYLWRKGLTNPEIIETLIERGVTRTDLINNDGDSYTDEVTRVELEKMLKNPSRKWPRAENLPTIQIIDGQLPLMVVDAEKALLRSNVPIYQRGGGLVRPAIVPIKTADGKTDKTLRLLEVEKTWLTDALGWHIRWAKYDRRTKKLMDKDCPKDIGTTILAHSGNWKFLSLSGIVTTPTLRADGSILQEPGYDVGSGLFFDPQTLEFPKVPEAPSFDQAMAALGRLIELFRDFPFVEDADRSVALSAILTGIIRRTLAQAPMHAFTAPTPGTGKSLLVDVVSLIITGAKCAVFSTGQTEEEFEKRLGGELMSGSTIMSIDNVDQEAVLGGTLLNQLLTQEKVKTRVLGSTGNPEYLTNLLVLATGNNLVVKGDTVRRVLLGSLDAKIERPELRTFNWDIKEFAWKNRAPLAVDALTILRAYVVASRPNHVPELGSFEHWSRTVREALIWLEQADPALTMEKVRGHDPSLQELRAVLSAWGQVFGNSTITTAELIRCANKRDQINKDIPDAPDFASFSHPELRTALMEVAARNNALNSRSLGRWIAKHVDRIVRIGDEDLVIRQSGISHKVQTWRLEGMKEEPGLF